ncbi:MAG: hypothetical protein KatS3mg059_0463 [Thermomicrobiales bacterium]|nr:MAG: hypothetical protein KatS3mg059_0463 [Thermomicrobiales bacterium]
MSDREASIRGALKPDEPEPSRLTRRRFPPGIWRNSRSNWPRRSRIRDPRGMRPQAALSLPSPTVHLHAAPWQRQQPARISANVSLTFFNPHEYETVDALTARIIPGTPDDPGGPGSPRGRLTSTLRLLVLMAGGSRPTSKVPSWS